MELYPDILLVLLGLLVVGETGALIVMAIRGRRITVVPGGTPIQAESPPTSPMYAARGRMGEARHIHHYRINSIENTAGHTVHVKVCACGDVMREDVD